jgi:DNA ligase 1
VKAFTQLYRRLDATTRTSEKLGALRDYFREAPPEDAAWALALFTGRRPKRAVSHTELRETAAAEAGLPLWMVDACYDAVGDLSETVSLLAPEREDEDEEEGLAQVIEGRIVPMRHMSSDERTEALKQAWARHRGLERFVFHKLISGSFRVGVQRKLVVRALAEIAGEEPAELDRRISTDWSPTPTAYQAIMTGEGLDTGPVSAYPFFLASQLEKPADTLGPPDEWRAEWKWDGIRAQLIARAHGPALWSRGDELIGGSFPELQQIGALLPTDTVMDGEVLAWDAGAPMPFQELQKRLNRKRRQVMLFDDVPVIFMAYDILEHAGEDVRERPTDERRHLLESLLNDVELAHGTQTHLRLSPLVAFDSWDNLATTRERSRDLAVEGLMLKRRDAPYRAGRVRGDWWKWKIDPLTIDAVLVAAQRGSGRRASLFTDYTFAVWSADPADDGDAELVTFAKAYSGLTDEEIDAVDAIIRSTTTMRRGPVLLVRPTQVFELAFEGLQRSDRHKAGIALRFPRMNRWRRDKKVEEADTLASLESLLDAQRATAKVEGVR